MSLLCWGISWTEERSREQERRRELDGEGIGSLRRHLGVQQTCVAFANSGRILVAPYTKALVMIADASNRPWKLKSQS